MESPYPEPQYRLCDVCKRFNVHSLLVAAGNAPSQPNTNAQGGLMSVKPGRIHQAIPRFFEHQPNMLALRASADACHLCSAIWKEYARQRQPLELTDDVLATGLNNSQVFLGTLDWDTGLSRTAHVFALLSRTSLGPPPSDIQRQVACFEVCAKHGEFPTQGAHLLARMQARSAADAECSSLARRWLEQCVKSHTRCEQTVVGEFEHPTRLLKIGHEALVSDSARLVQGDGCSGPYAALSYCWGGERNLLLTRKSEYRLRQGVPLSNFPPTLRDAITITEQLGLRYIWIDALCIFQDQEHQESKLDWATEVGRMRDVYRNATITIEAASASKASDGFLTERETSQPYCALPRQDEDRVSVVYLRPIFDITDSQLLGTKIFSRGWTLQERLLSPRTLSFGKQQMSFECVNGFVDEAGRSTDLPRPTEAYLSKNSMRQLRGDRSSIAHAWRAISRYLGLPPVVTLGTAFGVSFGWSSHGEIDVPGGLWATYYDYWRGIVQRFSERQLTNSQDRLAALSGLADEFQRATGGTYIAGMWHEELLLSLAWGSSRVYNTKGDYAGYSMPLNNFVNGPYPDNVKSKRYIAPSWSWASVQGTVKFPGPPYFQSYSKTDIARIQDVHITPAFPQDPLGSLSDGYLILQAPVLEILNPQAPCSADYSLFQLHSLLRMGRIQLTSDFATEFYQHHEPYDGQTYLLLHLFNESPVQGWTSVRMVMLLIESRYEGGYRRLCDFTYQLQSLVEMEYEHFRFMDSNDPNDKEYIDRMRPELVRIAAVSAELETALWVPRIVALY